MTLKHIRKSISKFSSLHVYLARKRLPGSDRGIQTNPFEVLSQEVKKNRPIKYAELPFVVTLCE